MKGYYIYVSLVVLLATIGLIMTLKWQDVRRSNETKKGEGFVDGTAPTAISKGTPEALMESMYADPANSSCTFYIQKYKTIYDRVLNDKTPEGARRRMALAVLVAARGKFSGALDSDLTYMDGCVVPRELMHIFGMNEECRTVKMDDQNRSFTLQLKPTPTYMEPQGCMMDFGNKMEPQTREITESEFYTMLDQMYFSMNTDLVNAMNALKIKIEELSRDLDIARGTIRDLDSRLTAANTNITSLTSERDSARSERDTCNGNLTNARNDLNRKTNDLNATNDRLVRYSSQVPLISLFNEWYSPTRQAVVKPHREIGLYNELSKTYMFWLHINEKGTGQWRNIFHVTSGEDMHRRPAVFINPTQSEIHICHDTEKTRNNPVNVPIDFRTDVHVALVWSMHTMDIYLNGNKYGGSIRYDSSIKKADSNASLYICDVFNYYTTGGFVINSFKIFNFAMNAEEVASERNK